MKKNSLLTITILIALTSQAQIISTLAGNGTADYTGDGQAATNASLNTPSGVAVDAKGNMFIADTKNNTIRRVDSNGVISSVAGKGYFFSGFKGDGGAATSAELNYPTGVAVDTKGNIYIADAHNNVIRKVNSRGIISTIAGTGTMGFSGDGGAATSAQLFWPNGVTVDDKGNIYIADSYNRRIRVVNSSGVISTIVGKGTQGYSGDGSAATISELYLPYGVSLDSSGNLYIADYLNYNLRKVDSKGIISTVAGINNNGFCGGDGGAAISACLGGPQGVSIDAEGNIYIADFLTNAIRKVNTSGIISTVAGNGTNGYGGDGGAATSAQLANPSGIAIDSKGNIYIADCFNNRIRKVTKGTLPIILASFALSHENNAIMIKWHTATELNTANFVIQHSTDGTSFTDIGTVKAIGSGANSYQFTDNAPTPYPLNGVLYYRLKSVDKDGSSTYSKVISVQLTIDNFQLSITPNPVKSSVTIRGSHIAFVQVVDNMGRVIKTQTLKDATNPILSVGGLPVGVYHLRVQTTDGKVSGVGFLKE